MLHLTPTNSFSHTSFQKFAQDVKDLQSTTSSLHEHHHPAELVDLALQALQRAKIEIVEWRSLLYRRMNVPNLVKDYSYAVADEVFEEASTILEGLGLPITPPSKFLKAVYGDLCNKGRFHRITKTKLPSGIQNIVIYPLSFTTLDPSEMTLEQPNHMQPSRCGPILVPRPSAVYASLVRMIVRCPQYSRIRTSLQSELSELIGYHLLRLEDGYVNPEDEETCEDVGIDRRIATAVSLVRQWSCEREWRKDEEWIGDALVVIIEGCDIGCLPYTS
ncbi:hypothetical protein D9613_007534 [Agrocybe pediades]|uniref:Uncharacterized protein n=1 Tax=Agrocybe pediades TaxID=84607 RepID=A0A8H4QN54_9AGAR|nr:hypothetical protein D9613_007534 [Agrocybe pediades]